MSDAVVIGIGNDFRGDDGVGPVAAAAVQGLLPHTDVMTLDGEPTRMVEAWAGHPLAVIIDAIRAGDPPGTIHRLEVGVDPLPQPATTSSTHGGGLAEAVALGEALGRNPDRLVVYGIEPATVRAGPGLAPVVRAAVPALAARVAEEVSRACA